MPLYMYKPLFKDDAFSATPVQIFDTRVIFGYDDSPMVNLRACAITIHTSISSHRWLDGNMSGDRYLRIFCPRQRNY